VGRLEGKVAIVTGAGGGIGREHALLLAREGAKVVVNDTGRRTGADAASVVAAIESEGGTAIASTTSATWDGAEEIVAAALDAFGGLDILVNNATAAVVNDLWRMTEKEWDLAIDVNLKGYFALVRAAAPHLCRKHSGAIVNTSSGSGFGHPSAIAYASSKEGVVGLTRTIARELGRFGVRCNAIRPFAAGVSTSEYATKTAKWIDVMTLTMGPRPGVRSVPNFDPGQFATSKIAPLVVWLCTDAASGVNGRTFNVGGDVVDLLSEPAPEKSAYQAGGWSLDGLDAASGHLISGLQNHYTLDDFPELQIFEE
jgi:NAD(P)-dependent dehydrogenase (short-subunit alcohol dehydrogenase family)